VAVAHVRAEAADVRGHGFAVRRLPELARQLEQVERRLEGDLVHFLPGTKARELRLLLVVLRADLHERAVAPHAHTDRTAAGGVRAEHARLRGLLASDRSLRVADALAERLPELLEQRHPLALAARHRVERILHPRGD